MKQPAFKRILLKLSGEALMGSLPYGISLEASGEVARLVKDLTVLGVQVGLVLGGGNFFRGSLEAKKGFSRVSLDKMGMLATIMNGIALKDALEKNGVGASVLSAIGSQGLVQGYTEDLAHEVLKKGHVALFVGGTGNPYFTTDSAAALRALEIGAEILFKLTKVDGVYDRDPIAFPDAVKYSELTYTEVLRKNLEVMDMMSIALCRKNRMPVRVLSMKDGSLKKAIFNEPVGTLVSGE